jgi:hypothetical protein
MVQLLEPLGASTVLQERGGHRFLGNLVPTPLAATLADVPGDGGRRVCESDGVEGGRVPWR